MASHVIAAVKKTVLNGHVTTQADTLGLTVSTGRVALRVLIIHEADEDEGEEEYTGDDHSIVGVLFPVAVFVLVTGITARVTGITAPVVTRSSARILVDRTGTGIVVGGVHATGATTPPWVATTTVDWTRAHRDIRVSGGHVAPSGAGLTPPHTALAAAPTAPVALSADEAHELVGAQEEAGHTLLFCLYDLCSVHSIDNFMICAVYIA